MKNIICFMDKTGCLRVYIFGVMYQIIHTKKYQNLMQVKLVGGISKFCKINHLFLESFNVLDTKTKSLILTQYLMQNREGVIEYNKSMYKLK